MSFLKNIKSHPLVLVLRDTWLTMKEAQLPQIAAALSYTTIFSIIPLLAVSLSIFKAFGGMEKLYATIEPYILQHLAEGASDEALATIRGFIGKIHAGALGASGMVVLVMACMNILMSAENAINRVWKTQVNRPLFQRVSAYWLLITLGPVAMSLAIGFATSGDLPLKKVIPGGAALFGAATLIFYLIYQWVPNRKVHWAPALISAAVAAVLWNLARMSYSIYTSRVLTYDKIYGSLGAIPILLLWIYILWLIVLSGAALTTVLQKRYDFK